MARTPVTNADRPRITLGLSRATFEGRPAFAKKMQIVRVTRGERYRAILFSLETYTVFFLIRQKVPRVCSLAGERSSDVAWRILNTTVHVRRQGNTIGGPPNRPIVSWVLVFWNRAHALAMAVLKIYGVEEGD